MAKLLSFDKKWHGALFVRLRFQRLIGKNKDENIRRSIEILYQLWVIIEYVGISCKLLNWLLLQNEKV